MSQFVVGTKIGIIGSIWPLMVIGAIPFPNIWSGIGGERRAVLTKPNLI